MNRSGSILVGLLWCLALLALVVVGVLHTSRMDSLVVRNYGDRIQAYYLALAGIERTKALLYQEARERRRSVQNHSGRLYNDAQQFRKTRLGRGEFSVFRAGTSDEGGGVIFGVSDEESRLNLNTASAEDLGKLYAITPDIPAAIVDWRDGDNAVTPGGAEAEHYASLQPPRRPRNGPFLTVRELAMIRGMSSRSLFGDDTHQTGLREPDGVESEKTPDVSAETVVSDIGWAGLMTVDSRVENVNAAGQDRVNAQTADESALTGVRGISQDIARAIIAYRGQNRIESLADLLDVTAATGGNPAEARGDPAGQVIRGQGRPGGNTGPKVISEELLLEMADDLTVSDDETTAGLVNVNTASLDVLICLPGVTRELAHAIISFRSSNGFLANVAWLLRVPGMTRDVFKQLAPRVTARSETFRILSEGRITSTGVRQRLQAIVHVGLNDVQTLSFREDNL